MHRLIHGGFSSLSFVSFRGCMSGAVVVGSFVGVAFADPLKMKSCSDFTYACHIFFCVIPGELQMSSIKNRLFGVVENERFYILHR